MRNSIFGEVEHEPNIFDPNTSKCFDSVLFSALESTCTEIKVDLESIYIRGNEFPSAYPRDEYEENLQTRRSRKQRYFAPAKEDSFLQGKVQALEN